MMNTYKRFSPKIDDPYTVQILNFEFCFIHQNKI